MSGKYLISSLNPATEEVLATFPETTSHQLENILNETSHTFRRWRQTSMTERRNLMEQAATYLRTHKNHLATLITEEMGKPIAEAESEVEKCAWNCEFYAAHSEALLADQPHPSKGKESYVSFLPLGTVFAIMPWNYPLWQVIRFAAPALMAGNTAILKHATNVPRCALAAQDIFQESGFPPGVFRTVLLSGANALGLIGDPRIAAVTVTGSTRAGSQIAATAGHAIKKTVLELGGSDAFIVLADADLSAAVTTGVQARYQNAGQSCVAAKRFLVVESIFDDFLEQFVATTQALRIGDPLDRAIQMGPLARHDLRVTLEQQVQQSIAHQAVVHCGGHRLGERGFFFAPTVMTTTDLTAPIAREEVFGPVAAIIQVRDATHAVAVANDSSFGLGATLWTADMDNARRLARELEVGFVAINGKVASDPRLPFGGVKQSGYGRELSEYGIREFVNIQSVWMGEQDSTGD